METMRRNLAALLCVLVLATGLASPAAAGAETPISVPGMELVFEGARAHSDGDLVSVPVRCLGEGRGFCSGVVTLSSGGHRQTVPFAVQAGSHESLFVPLRIDGGGKVRGVATTDQRLGPPSSIATLLYIH
jgi:hypothetical protein